MSTFLDLDRVRHSELQVAVVVTNLGECSSATSKMKFSIEGTASRRCCVDRAVITTGIKTWSWLAHIIMAVNPSGNPDQHWWSIPRETPTNAGVNALPTLALTVSSLQRLHLATVLNKNEMR